MDLRRWRRPVVTAALVAAVVLVGGGSSAAPAPLRAPADSLCRLASNDEYVARVDRILAYYRHILEYHHPPEADDKWRAAASAVEAGEYGFTPLFQLQACSVDEYDLSGAISDQGGMYYGLRQVIYDPEFHGDAWRAAPIDIEVAWYAELGLEGLIAGWSTIARLDHENVGDIQRLLSLGLAHATNPDRDAILGAGAYADFVADKDRHLGYEFTYAFTDLGGKTVQLARHKGLLWASGPHTMAEYLLDDPSEWELIDVGPRVYGWSVLAPLLRFGYFHEQFLVPVATAIVQFDRARDGDWRIEGEESVAFDAIDNYPTNAFDAVLEALRRNPGAAEAVFEATGDQRVEDLLEDS